MLFIAAPLCYSSSIVGQRGSLFKQINVVTKANFNKRRDTVPHHETGKANNNNYHHP
jgi:hypothetical protein